MTEKPGHLSVSIYQQVREYVYGRIRRGELEVDQKLSSERELVEFFNSSRITIREALIRLESEGVIYRANRRGWFVAPKRLVLDLTKKTNFNELAIAQGRKPRTYVVSKELTKLPSGVRSDLVTENGDGFCLCRVRGLEDRYVMAEKIYLDLDQFPGFNNHDLAASTTALLDEVYKVQIAREHCTIQIEALSEEMACLLETNIGAPCIQVVRRRYSVCGRLVDFNMEYWIHNAIQMEVETR